MAVRSAKELGLHVEHIHAGKPDLKPVIFDCKLIGPIPLSLRHLKAALTL